MLESLFYRWIRFLLGPLAQSVEQRTFNPWVVGSIPTGPTLFFNNYLSVDFRITQSKCVGFGSKNDWPLITRVNPNKNLLLLIIYLSNCRKYVAVSRFCPVSVRLKSFVPSRYSFFITVKLPTYPYILAAADFPCCPIKCPNVCLVIYLNELGP